MGNGEADFTGPKIHIKFKSDLEYPLLLLLLSHFSRVRLCATP